MTISARADDALSPDPQPVTLIRNIIAFQVGWVVCVMGAAYGWNWPGVLAALVVTIWHLSMVANPAAESRLMLAVLALGFTWDSLLALQGWIQFLSGTVIDGFAPPWILALWLMFATTLNVSLRWLQGRSWAALLLGAVFGPLSYWGAMRLGAVEFLRPGPLLLMLSIGWALMMPLLLMLARRFDGVTPAFREV